jgi:hypothetical protein
MSTQIMLTVFARLQRHRRSVLPRAATGLAQFRHTDADESTGREVVVTDIDVPERPPLATVLRDGARDLAVSRPL